MTAQDDLDRAGPPGSPDARSAEVERARAGLGHTATPYRTARRRRGRREAWGDFVHRYGWRAYAVPVLAVVTVVALATAWRPQRETPRTVVAARPTAGASSAPGSSVSAPTPTTAPATSAAPSSAAPRVNPAVLPAGPAYTQRGAGTFRMLKGTSRTVGKGRLYRYAIEVEDGIHGINLTQFQDVVERTLSDRRSWSGHGIALRRVDSGPVDFRVTLTSSMTVRKLCGYTIPVETSCYAAAGPTTSVNRVVFNDARWVRGAEVYPHDVAAYRVYMINHEDGHALGHEHAHQCLPGGLAPAMMQQTFGLRSAATGKLCRANPWPYPTGVSGAPGAEQPDTAANDEYGRGD